MQIYRAVIENNISPDKDGRVQVRIFGIHSEKLDEIQTEHLPWAEVIQSNVFGFNSGIGLSSVPNIGTWVFVLLDHDNVNMPIVIGAISAKSIEKADTSKGFNSPDGIYPLVDRLNEQDQNRLQRIDKLDKTIHKKINDTVDKVTTTDPTSGADVTMTEPNSLSDASKYPDNTVIETKSGHVIEIDDTPGNEKIRLYHKSGTYTDYRPDGSKIQKTKLNQNEIIEGYIYKHIKKSVKTYIDENLDEIIGKNVKKAILGTLDEHIVKAVNRTLDDTLTETVAGAVTQHFNSDQTVNIGGALNIDIGGTCTINSGGNMKFTAPKIDLN